MKGEKKEGGYTHGRGMGGGWGVLWGVLFGGSLEDTYKGHSLPFLTTQTTLHLQFRKLGHPQHCVLCDFLNYLCGP